ncbi:type I secretion system permease/ATPase [Sphingomonas aerophila]|uniref:ATP-binding cassette subfamily C protein n=1 Tax=Sphingomonas aerophila TaxID=1344948 RepID=A0A7W9EXC0_9SPHN|nr:type I secretion system permease/ATPase [Sphingomonas aerophila]MBB5716647.1 ATP-binding cassette subfamily C protein [Sphingomonas aerophila]
MAAEVKLGTPLWRAVHRYRTAFITVAILSAVLNVLLLGGSIYMMLVYDSVLPSHSLPTLFSLLAMITIVYAFQALFDMMRSRILNDVGSALDQNMQPLVQRAISEAALRGGRFSGDGMTPMRDLDNIRAFLSGTGPTTLIDLPWIVFFLVVLSMLHIWLGVTALVGALIMIGMTWMTDRATKAPTQEIGQLTSYRSGMAESNLRHVEVLTALGMRERMRDRWSEVNKVYLASNDRLARSVAVLGGSSKVFRMFLQSAILTVGALLVIDGKASGGVIFASSILSGRSLAPIDTAIANWRGFASARAGWRRLNDLFARLSAAGDAVVQLPRPSKELLVEQVVIAPPGTQRVTVQHAQFRLGAGDALGIIGPSAAGKTSLARALIGVWPVLRGSVRLDGATRDQWDPERFGEAIGYLPQTVELLEGTVAENIARFEPDAPSEVIIAAAQAAGVHDLVVALPQGYETPVGSDGTQLSAGQRQRIGLARALYGNPFLVLLDEPNSNLDQAGEEALEHAIAGVRARGGIAIVIAHRPSALARVSHVLFMRDGRQEAFGPRDEVLAKIMSKPIPINAGVEAADNSRGEAPRKAAGGER